MGVEGTAPRFELGAMAPAMSAAMATAAADRVVERIWAHDPELWKPGDEAHAAVIRNRLGWLLRRLVVFLHESPRAVAGRDFHRSLRRVLRLYPHRCHDDARPLMQKILIIDDNPTHRLINRKWIELLRPGRFNVIEAVCAATGIDAIVRESPACVLLDFMMLGDDGFQALHKMKHDIPDCPPVIFLTCALTEDLKRNALALGADSCFDKSRVTGEELVQAVVAAVERNARG